MTRKPRIIFIGHDSSLTGAPVLLLNLLEILMKTNKYDIKLILSRGGPLENNFRCCVPVYLLKSAAYSQTTSTAKRFFNYLKFKSRLLTLRRKVKGADLIVSNTVANGRLLRSVSKLNIPIVTYVHELESVIKYFESNNDSLFSLTLSDCFICPSNAVSYNLISNHKIPEQKIEYLPYFIKNDSAVSIDEIHSYRQRIFVNNNIPENRFYIAGMGTATSRKGIDLFLEVCKTVVKQQPDICFVWIGDFEDEAMEEFIMKQIAENHLQKFFFITGKQPHNSYNLSPFDILFLSSREDPYPLIVLEAALLQIPTLYFENTGGIGEFVNTDAGWPIEKFEINKVSDEILRLKNNPEEIKKKGRCAFEKVTRIHADENVITSTFAKIIEKKLKSKR